MINTLTNLKPVRTSRRRQLRLGIRAHDFGRMRAEVLAACVAAAGFDRVQLALNKAIDGLQLAAGDLNAALAREIGGAFHRHGVRVEVLGCYINPIHPDLVERGKLLAYFKDHLRLARDFGCGIVALESGSVNADYSPHPANQGEAAFQEMLASIAELVAEAESLGVTVGFETVHGHTVFNARRMRRVVDAVGSKHLRVVFDAANLLSDENFGRRGEVIAEALDLLGPEIAVVHAKDLVCETGRLRVVPPGCGGIDFAPVLDFVAQSGRDIAVLLEEAGPDAARRSAQFLRGKFDQ